MMRKCTFVGFLIGVKMSSDFRFISMYALFYGTPWKGFNLNLILSGRMSHTKNSTHF